MTYAKRKQLFLIIWNAVGVIFLFAWTLTHWFFYDHYARFLGVPEGTYQDSLIKMIGTCGVLLSMCFFVIAREPEKSRLLIKMVSAFLVLLAGTFLYLVLYSDFSKAEILNAVAFVAIAVFLPVSTKLIKPDATLQ